MKRVILIGAASAFALITGCTVGPNYQRASVPTPPQWAPQEPFRAAVPKDAIPKGTWWTIFGDEQLNGLEAKAMSSNQTIEVARTQLDQARSLAKIQTAGLLPTLNVNPSVERERLSGSRPVTSGVTPLTPVTQNVLGIPFNLNYEIDLFGRVRRNVEAANAQYQSYGANLENIRLLIASDLAADYFSLRELDSEIAVVNSAAEFEQKGLDLVNRRHEGGVASGLDVAQQKTLLDATLAQQGLLVQQRAQYQDAIAVLVGLPAPTFQIATAKMFDFRPPAFPVGVPSDVLERRPDVAQAERSMASQNALIGVAESAYYPSISLFGSGGYQSRNIGSLVSAPSAVWALGIDAVQSIFNGGRTHAQVEYYRSGYQGSVASYRNTVLTAFQQVQDGLAGLDALERAGEAQQAAVVDAQTALTIANNRYVGGVATYLDVITAQETLLNNQRLQAQILGQRLVTSVYLVKALGGGWDASSLNALHVSPTLKQAFTQ